MTREVAIMIFDNVEVLDFCGPFEVFAVCRAESGDSHFEVFTVAQHDGPVIARNGLSVNPAYTFDSCPKPDIIVIPGGRGTRTEVDNEIAIDWIRRTSQDTEQTLSVCTGAFLLAKAGLLTDLQATTYHTAFDALQAIDSSITLRPGERFVDNGHVVTSAGVSAGIDMSLYVVAKLLGIETANRTAQHMEYEHWSERFVSSLES